LFSNIIAVNSPRQCYEHISLIMYLHCVYKLTTYIEIDHFFEKTPIIQHLRPKCHIYYALHCIHIWDLELKKLNFIEDANKMAYGGLVTWEMVKVADGVLRFGA
jgi:hypothetical protein